MYVRFYLRIRCVLFQIKWNSMSFSRFAVYCMITNCIDVKMARRRNEQRTGNELLSIAIRDVFPFIRNYFKFADEKQNDIEVELQLSDLFSSSMSLFFGMTKHVVQFKCLPSNILLCERTQTKNKEKHKNDCRRKLPFSCLKYTSFGIG